MLPAFALPAFALPAFCFYPIKSSRKSRPQIVEFG